MGGGVGVEIRTRKGENHMPLLETKLLKNPPLYLMYVVYTWLSLYKDPDFTLFLSNPPTSDPLTFEYFSYLILFQNQPFLNYQTPICFKISINSP